MYKFMFIILGYDDSRHLIKPDCTMSPIQAKGWANRIVALDSSVRAVKAVHLSEDNAIHIIVDN